MQVAVAFEDRVLSLDFPEGIVLGAWQGPPGLPSGEVAGAVAAALGATVDFPPVRQALVPGDRVTVALGADTPAPTAVLAGVCRILGQAGVTPDSLTVLVEPGFPESALAALPRGLTVKRHDPADRTGLAYVASTPEGRRVYLSRELVDADFVLPVGLLRHDPVFGTRGPWSVVFPALSDAETRQDYASRLGDERPDRAAEPAALAESLHVSWLLGSQAQLGLVAGVEGLSGALCGTASGLRDLGRAELERLWACRTEARAELVIAGVGGPGRDAGIAGVAQGLAAATRLVRRGGKIVLLSRARGPLGPALQRLMAVGEPLRGLAALRGHEADPDYAPAAEFARAVAWADVYLHSELDPDAVDGLSAVPLDKPEDARRLAAQAGSCVVVSQADLVGASVAGETE